MHTEQTHVNPTLPAEIPLDTPRCWLLRGARISLVGTLWFDFGSDVASGLSAARDGQRAIAAALLFCGVLEFFLNVHVINTGMIMPTRRTFWAHTLVETPVVVASSIALARSDLPLSNGSQVSYMVAIASTAVTLTSTAVWLYTVQPRQLARSCETKVSQIAVEQDSLRQSNQMAVTP